MSIFELVKVEIPIRDAVEHYGFRVNRNGMICCPFHEDHTPSLKLNQDYYFCFGCGAHGDVIDFVARIFGLTQLQAAKKLAYDFGLDPNKPPAAATLKKPRVQQEKQALELEKDCHRIACRYLHLLEDWKEHYAPRDREAEWDSRYVKANSMLDYVEYVADVLTVGEEEERKALAEQLCRDGTIHLWAARLAQAEKEEYENGKQNT